MSINLAAWVLERPWGLAAFALPLLVLLAARRRDRPRAIFAATFALFASSAERPAESERTRRRPPPRTWIYVAALTLGAVGLAGPRPLTTRTGRTWRVVVDRSPSMGLAAESATRQTVATRQSVALDRARSELAAHWRTGDRVRWVAIDRAELGFEDPDAQPDVTWLRPEPAEGGDPRWDEEDRAGTLWVTDAAPHLAGSSTGPARAWLIASGGPAVPGPVAVEGRDRLDWDGEQLVRVADGAPPRWVELSATPGALGEFAEVWARTRGLALAPERAGAAPALRVAGPPSEGASATSGRATRVAGGGWGAACVVEDDLDDRLRGEVLLADASGRACAWGARGELLHAFLEFGQPAGDPGAFAHHWARLFDELLPAAPGVLALGERRAAGAPRSVPGLPPELDGDGRTPPPIAAWCAALAALLGVIAVAPLRRGAARISS